VLLPGSWLHHLLLMLLLSKQQRGRWNGAALAELSRPVVAENLALQSHTPAAVLLPLILSHSVMLLRQSSAG
jgi:hypothetical protein